ncbi:MAG: beta-galactosidase [Lentisphaeria bacterium]|nr:beta-galactosidase [Lentisphaeria bacterium]NQZ68878.1 beta-galactosidase [Lentisphaeria bacterium]
MSFRMASKAISLIFGLAILSGMQSELLADEEKYSTIWVGNWPLDKIVIDPTGPQKGKAFLPNSTGGTRCEFAGKDPLPKLVEVDKKIEMRFADFNKGGCLSVTRGGAILFGPKFHIYCEVKIRKLTPHTAFIACKSGGPMGGFKLIYMSRRKILQFQFSDTKENYTLECILDKPLKTNKWLAIDVKYDSKDLIVSLDGKEVGRKAFKDKVLAKNRHRYPLLFGGYSNTNFFAGSIRNVKLCILMKGINAPAHKGAEAYARNKEFKYPDPEAIKVGVYSSSYNKARAAKFISWLKGKDFEMAKKISTDEIITGGILDPKNVDVLIMPDAKQIPLKVWQKIPPYIAKGGHIIFDGVPKIALTGEDDKWTEFPIAYASTLSWAYNEGPGTDLHCYYELNKLRGLWRTIDKPLLRSDIRLKKLIEFSRPYKPRGGGTRSIQPVVFRHGSAKMLLKRTYRNCMTFNPFFFSDGDELLAQQAVMVRHHCSVLNGGTTSFVDITNPKAQGFRLLTDADGPKILAAMVRLSKGTWPGEMKPHVYETYITLKDQLSYLKDRYIESTYLDQSITFLATNLNRQSDQEDVKNVNAKFKDLEKQVLGLSEGHALWRENDTPAALYQKEFLLASVNNMLKKVDSHLAIQGNLRKKLLAASSKKSVPLPKGEMQVGLSVCDDPLHGYMHHRMKKYIQDAGMDTYASSLFFYFNDDTAKDIAYEKARAARLEQRCKDIGYDFAPQIFGPLPHSLVNKYKDKEGRPGWNPLKGKATKRIPWSKKMYVTPVFSDAFKDPEYRPWLKRRGEYMSKIESIKVISSGGEGLMHEYDGYSPKVIKLYQKWLKKYFGRISKLNDTWNTKHKTFDRIDSPRAYPKSQSEKANWYQWNNFRAESVTDYFATVYKEMKKGAPNKLISSCMNQASTGDGLDYYAFCKYQDKAGFHNTPTNKPWYSPGLAPKGIPGMNSETKSISPHHYPWRSGGEQAKQFSIRFDTMRFLASGVTEVQEFTWGGDGLGQSDGFLNLSGAEYKHFNRWKEKWEGVVGGEHGREWADVGLYWSFATKVQMGFPQKNFYLAFRLMDRWNAILDSLNVPFETIPRQKVKAGEINHLKLIILPQNVYLEKEVAQKLLAYVKQGGKILLVGEGGKYDEFGTEMDLFFQEAGLVYTAMEAVPVVLAKQNFPTTALRTNHDPEDGDHVVGFSTFIEAGQKTLRTYDDDTPAVVSAPIGKGQIYFLGFALSDTEEVLKGEYSRKGLVHQLIQPLLTEMKINRPITCSDPNMLINTWKGKNGWHYAIIQNRSADEKNCTMTIPGKVSSLVELNDLVTIRKKDGADTIFSMPFMKAGARAIAWRK